MEFQCQFTDGSAQLGILSYDSQKITIPTIVFPSSDLYHPPAFAQVRIDSINHSKKNKIDSLIQVGESIFFKQHLNHHHDNIVDYFVIPESLPSSVQQYLYQFDKQHHKNISILPANETLLPEVLSSTSSKLYIVSNAFQLFSNPKSFVSYLINLRSLINYDSLLLMPGIAEPATLAMLCYCGIDIFDATRVILASRHQQFFLPDTSSTSVQSITENPCVCPICAQTKQKPELFSFEQLLTHNYYLLYQELLTIRHAVRKQQLRDLVEKRIRHSPHLVTILRYFDTIGYQFIEQRTPVSMPESFTLQSTSREAGFRSEIKRFQHRVLNRYKKPEKKKILLLLPCSAKKPYSLSKSHQRFYHTISRVKNHSIIHEVIVTSPLGLVPRELELCYPASSYDISVTGEWYADEKKIIQEQFQQYLSSNKYDAIVSHLPNDIINPPKGFKSKWYRSLTNKKATSKDALLVLYDKLTSLTTAKEYGTISKVKQRCFQIHAIATFQFGEKLANLLTKNITVKGRYPSLKFFDENGQQLGMVPEGRGLISLTAEGGERLKHIDEYRVTIDTGFTVKGSVLAPGVIDADESIRRGDDVIVFQGDRFLGVGCALMNGVEMTQRSYGEAVNMRHKTK